MNAVIALSIIAAVIVATVAFGSWGVRRVKMNPHEMIVGGRSFGAVFLWVLLAGEIYTTFTFLGVAGWAYGKGAPAFYILCYTTVAYVLSYYLGPAIWRVAKSRQLLTSPDFFAVQYDSRSLGLWVSVVSFVFAIPYTTLQLSGIQTILRIAGYDSLKSAAAVGIAFSLIIVFVFTCGLRGVAWASLIKDFAVLLALGFAGIWLPIHFFGSPAAVIDRVLAAHPGWMTLQSDASNKGVSWFISTVILTALGFYMWPQAMAAIYASHDEKPLRTNAILLPIYQLLILLVCFAGWTALLLVPGLEGARADESFMLVVQRYFSPWVLGCVGAAGCLAGLVPASVQLLAAASILSKNVLADQFGLARNEDQQTWATRFCIVFAAAGAFVIWLFAKSTLVEILLVAYGGITQLFPGVALSFASRRPHASSVGIGILAGLVLLGCAERSGMLTIAGLNAGMVALAVNCAVLFFSEAFQSVSARQTHAR